MSGNITRLKLHPRTHVDRHRRITIARDHPRISTRENSNVASFDMTLMKLSPNTEILFEWQERGF